jgi:hypothetical protein
LFSPITTVMYFRSGTYTCRKERKLCASTAANRNRDSFHGEAQVAAVHCPVGSPQNQS